MYFGNKAISGTYYYSLVERLKYLWNKISNEWRTLSNNKSTKIIKNINQPDIFNPRCLNQDPLELFWVYP